MKNRRIRFVMAGLLLVLLGVGATALRCGPGLCLQTPLLAQSAVDHATAVAPPAADTPVAPNAPITGLAILGDSTQDEYHANSARGGDFAAVTYNWVEQLVNKRDLNVGEWGTFGEPRRSGFAYNWARSGATSGQMVTEGQLTGAMRQVLAEKVSHVMIQIGLNDFYFSGMGVDLYNGTLSQAEVHARLDKTARNIMIAALVLQAAGKQHVIVAAVQDYATVPIIPELKTVYTDAAGRTRIAEAFSYVNGRLQTLSAQFAIPYFDYNTALLAEINKRVDSENYLVVGGERINLNQRGNDPHFGMLDDQYAHPGTVISGLIANVYVAEMNSVFGTHIAPLSDEEILQSAGLRQ